jgi:ankyrin repeat protein
MNAKMLAILQGEEKFYPLELEKQFLRVMLKIIEVWYTPQAGEYFNDLMVDKRGDGRNGFPPEVSVEIFHLSQVHERTRTVANPDADSPWTLTDDRDLQRRDMPVTESRKFIDPIIEFQQALETGNTQAIGQLLKHGADLNMRDESGATPLMLASSIGNEEIVILLINQGADIHARDNAGYIALHWAAYNGNGRIVRLLLLNNSDPNARSNFGWTPIMQAATRGHVAAAKLLITGGCNVNLASEDGWTPLHKATTNGHLEVVKLLLNHYADRHLQLQDGSTALTIATKNKNDAIITLLNSND